MSTATDWVDEPDTHYVYRCYGADDRLLYIGCTRDLGSRFAVHHASWGNPASFLIGMRMARHTVEEYPDKASARVVEREAIAREKPLGNVLHIKGRTGRERDAEIAAYMEETRPPVDPWLAGFLAGEHPIGASTPTT